ncbi:hypothetical protein [Mucilaginibacter sp. UYCu711]|uniref:hypothetical protein n=1 Tax=Mucilaginibacter sp. UYCu711 TaxID=3156339 RepID=UPI003D1BED97
MFKKLGALLLIINCISCHKSNQQACGTQVCTYLFAIITVHFADRNGQGVSVQNYSAVNQRTHEKLLPTAQLDAYPGTYAVADDNMRSKFSNEGDDVVVSGTSPTTGQTKTVTLKISGGCNCHVNKESGDNTVVFD